MVTWCIRALITYPRKPRSSFLYSVPKAEKKCQCVGSALFSQLLWGTAKYPIAQLSVDDFIDHQMIKFQRYIMSFGCLKISGNIKFNQCNVVLRCRWMWMPDTKFDLPIQYTYTLERITQGPIPALWPLNVLYVHQQINFWSCHAKILFHLKKILFVHYFKVID